MKKGSNKNWLKIGSVVLGVIALGTGVWYFGFRKSKDTSLADVKENTTSNLYNPMANKNNPKV